VQTPPQFGPALDSYNDRPSSYVVILEDSRGLLVLEVGGAWHLPGGGIDPDEDPETATVREAREEGGLSISNLEYLGQANQFFPATDVGDINKVGHFFKGDLTTIDSSGGESDHRLAWMSPENFLASNANDFHKWAVKRALNGGK
jgi:8-oxo-dGTP pyrophosphatase MutT (NUDIX family)